MHLAHEYAGYAIERRPLCVKEPNGEQRSIYWLQSPCTYDGPLLVTPLMLHLLMPQSILLAHVIVWEDDPDEIPENAIDCSEYEYVTTSAIGHSCAPILCHPPRRCHAVRSGFAGLQEAPKPYSHGR